MLKKIKDWFAKVLDLNADGKVTAEDVELAQAIAEKTFKEANDQITDAVTQVKKATKGRKKK